MRLAAAVLPLAGVMLGTDIGQAQSLSNSRAGVIATSSVAGAFDSASVGDTKFDALRRHTSFAPLASLIVPGTGQFMLRNDRFLAYIAVEALAWWKYAKDVRDRAHQESEFKELARSVARKPFSTNLPDAGWLYYEWMRDRLESGRYSVTAIGPIVPETDTSTYNGNRWVLAQSTNRTMAEALAQYEREAIRPEYRWSWRGAQLQYDIYKRTTDKRNDAAHAAAQDLLVIGANHVLSMVDAFAAIRLRVQPVENGRTGVGASVRW